MKDPEQLYRNAYFTRFKGAISLNGKVVPVYQKSVPSNTERPYICLAEVSITNGGTGQKCQSWDCTILVDIVTQYDNNTLKASDVISVGAKVIELTEGIDVNLGTTFQINSHVMDQSQTLTEQNDAFIIDRRLIRFRNKIFEL